MPASYRSNRNLNHDLNQYSGAITAAASNYAELALLDDLARSRIEFEFEKTEFVYWRKIQTYPDKSLVSFEFEGELSCAKR